MTNEYRHIPVLLNETIQNLSIDNLQIFVDATIGGSGHSIEMAKRLGSNGYLIGIDQDQIALDYSKKILSALDKTIRPTFKLLHGNFGEIDSLLLKSEVPGIDAILFDLGVSSQQIDTLSRGFSFKKDAPLDMRMDREKQNLTAQEIVNTYSESDLGQIIYQYSEEKWASRIAKFIVQARKSQTISTSSQLVEIIKSAIPASARRSSGHPAKRTFQALRIEVNSELDVLKRGLNAAIRWLNPGGRLGVISYHSLEDRIVKDLFKQYATGCTCPPDLPVCVCGNKPILKILTKKPIIPSQKEIQTNPRSRSAKLRVAQKLDEKI